MKTAPQPGQGPHLRGPAVARWLWLAVLFILGIGAAGCLLYDHQLRDTHKQAEQELESVVELKADELALWLKERQGDLVVVQHSQRVHQFLATPNAALERQQLVDYLDRLREAYGYDAIGVFDAHGTPLLVSPEHGLSAHSCVARHIQQGLAIREIAPVEFHRGTPGEPIHFSFLVPIRSGSSSNATLLGAVLLTVNPQSFFYPRLQHWPTPSDTAELLFLRREGEDVLFMNESRHRPGTAVQLRLPGAATNLACVRAALLGVRHGIHALDYRGEPVLAAARAIPGTSWILVAKMDQAEVERPLRFDAWMIGATALTLMFIMALIVTALWREQRLNLLRDESERKFKLLFESSRDAIMTLEPPSWRFTTVNPATVAMFHAKDAADVMAHPPWELSPEKQPDGRTSRELARDMIEKAIREGVSSFEWTHRRLDGEEFPATVLLTRLEFRGQQMVQATIRDLTARKRAEAAAAESQSKYQALVEATSDFIWEMDVHGTYTYCSPQMKTLWGFNPHAMVGRSPFDVMPAETQAQARALLQQMVARREPFVGVQLPSFDSQGQPIFIETSGIPFFDAHGTLLGYRGITRDITERKRNEAMLLAAEENKFNTLLQGSADGILICEAAARKIHRGNPASVQLLGYSLAELAALRIDDLQPADAPPLALEQPAPWPDLQLKRKDGSNFYAQLTPLTFSVGATHYVALLFRDTTGQRQAETQLRASEERFRAIFQGSCDGIVLADPATQQFKFCNETMCQLTGYSSAELAGMNVAALHRPADLTLVQRSFKKLLRRELKVDRDIPVRRKDGSIFYADVNAAQITIEGVTYLAGYFRDVTERKEQETALQTSERLQRVILDNIPDPAWMKDLEGRFLAVNQSWCKFVGLSPEQAIGHLDTELFSPAAGRKFREEETRVAAEGRTLRTEEMLPDRQGGQHYFETFKAPVADAGGRVHATIGISRDITERKQAETSNHIQLELATALSSCHDVVTGLRHCMMASIQATGCDSGGIYLLDEDTGAFDLLVHQGLSEEFVQAVAHFERATPAGQLAAAGVPVYTRYSEMGIPLTPAQLREGMSFLAVLPMHHEGRVIGCMNIASHTLQNLPPALRQRLEIIADTAATAVVRLKVEHSLRESRQRLQMALDAACMGVWEYNFETQRLYWSPEIFKNLGVPAMEPTRERMLQLTHPEDVDLTQQAMDKALREHTPYRCEYRLILDGQTIWLEDRGQILRDGQDRPLRVVGTAQNITLRKQGEGERLRLATAVEQAAEIVFITDKQGRIEYVNPAFERTTGYAAAEALGQTPRLLKSGHHDAAFYQHLWATISAGETWRGHITNKRKDGTLYEEDAVISPIRNAGGQIVSYVAAKRDITREQVLEAQIRQAQKMEALGQLAGGVAHDFNNLLQAAIGLTELLLASLPPAGQQREDVLEIARISQRAAALTRQLLAFSRQETSQPVVVDLNTLVENAQKMLRRLIGEDIRITLELANLLPAIQADIGQLDQILMNLCINARDAMPEGGQLKISTTAVTLDADAAGTLVGARPGTFVCLTVRDTGVGIPPALHARIFEPFFSTKGPGKGTGLGLAVIYGIVQQHAGWINLVSAPGAGATFKIYLPVTSSAATGESAGGAAGTERGHGERILLIEDETVVRNLISRVLRRAGYTVLEAATSTEGVALFEREQGRFDLVFSDVVLPDRNGIATVESLQQLKPELAVVLCSGYTDERSRWHAITEKRYPFIQKPCAAEDLLHVIQTTLRTRPTPHA